MIRQGEVRLAAAGVTFAHGTDNALDESAWLVLHAVGLRPNLPVTDPDLILTSQQREAAERLIERRIRERQPAAYLTGRAWFGGLELVVDERVLVPRSPLAEPIMQGFTPWFDPTSVGRVLDLCTGSGCIAVACAYAFPEALIDATDISLDALDVAAINLRRHGLEHRIELLCSDLFAAVNGRRYDLIVSNPPYVDADEMSSLAPEFLHEPALALAAGDDGLDIVRRILGRAACHLTEQGMLVVEVGNSARALEAAFPQLPFNWLEFDQGGGGVFLLTREELISDG
jgi:ribosomal protein L3 glutamine methyltransferase